MRGQLWIGRWLKTMLPILIVLVLLPPSMVYSSGGEVDLNQYISPEEGVVYVGETVTFGVGSVPLPGITVRWNFGDDSPEEAGWPVLHSYDAAGEYEVTAVITYPSGETVPTIPTRIRVRATGDTVPQAQAQASPETALSGMPITFDGTASFDSDGEIIRYYWIFGDGSTSDQATVEHVYAQEGTYHVILTVTDNGEMDASDIVTVTVISLPTIILPGVDRVVPPPAGYAPPLPNLILMDMGLWDVERFPFYQSEFELEPPFRGVASSNRNWLSPDPTDFERLEGSAVVMTERISVRNTSLLPRGHTSWAQITLIINGRIVEMPTSVTVLAPAGEIIPDEVWGLHQEILDYLTERGQRNKMVYTLRYGNSADMVLGLITEYLLEDGYGGEIPRQGFVEKVAELLMDQDENGDGFIGFTDLDRGLGLKIED